MGSCLYQDAVLLLDQGGQGEQEMVTDDIAAPDECSLAEYAGISYRSVKSALHSLEENYFIAPTVDGVENEYWKMFRSPPYSFR